MEASVRTWEKNQAQKESTLRMSLSQEDHDALMYAIGVGLANLEKKSEPESKKKPKTAAKKPSKRVQEWSQEDESLHALPEPVKRKVAKTSTNGRGRGAAKSGRGGHGGRSRRASSAGCASCGHDE
jgi:hypothetical protein